MEKLYFLLFFSACLAAIPNTHADAGTVATDCESAYSGPQVDVVLAGLIEPYRTDGGHPSCPQVGCDSNVALPFCGPFNLTPDGGVRFAGGLFVSDDESVIKVNTWRGELFFAAPSVSDPRGVALMQTPSVVVIPQHVGQFRAFSTGLGMTSATGVSVPPQACLGAPIFTTRQLRIGAHWKYFWRPIGRSDWLYCGPVDG